MPIAFDFALWMRASGFLAVLAKGERMERLLRLDEGWDVACESLVERVTIDGDEWVGLSPIGTIFHEAFRDRFRTDRDQVLPPPVPEKQKKKPHIEKDGGASGYPEIRRFLESVTCNVPQVKRCVDIYFNPDLASATLFRMSRGEILGVYSNGTYTEKFLVETLATTEGQRQAVVALLNSVFSE